MTVPEKPYPRISIITVVYNAAATLEKTIQSVIGQTYRPMEYIIIDGGSQDGSQQLIKKYEKQLAYWISEPDSGIYDAMNKGLQIATGDLVGIINADDWYEPTALEHIAAAQRLSPGTTVFHGLLRVINKNGGETHITGHSSNFLSAGMIEHPTCFVKREAYEQWGYFNPAYKSAGDYELMLRFKNQQASFVFLPTIIANFREGGQSNSWISTKETLALQKQYRLISGPKRVLLLLYWYIKQALLARKT